MVKENVLIMMDTCLKYSVTVFTPDQTAKKVTKVLVIGVFIAMVSHPGYIVTNIKSLVKSILVQLCKLYDT